MIDSCIPCCGCCSGGEIAFLIFAWFRESLISAGWMPSFCNWVEISVSESPCCFIVMILSSVAILSYGICSIYLFLN